MNYAVTFIVTMVATMAVLVAFIAVAWHLVTRAIRRRHRRGVRPVDLTYTTTDRSRRGPWIN